MELIDDLSDLRERDPARPVCVLSPSPDDTLAREAAGLLQLDPESPLDLRDGRRPAVEATDDEIDALAFSLGEGQEWVPVHLRATERGLLVVARDIARELLRRAVEPMRDDGRTALVAALVALAQQSGERLDDLVEELQDLGTAARGYTSAPERRRMAGLRTHLFALAELEATQYRLFALEDEFTEALPDSAERMRRRAGAVFDENRATARRLYALLGDLLTEQSSAVMERLTLVSTIFLPLTLATGFFGMNFDWMTERIGTLPAFLILGIVAPLLTAAATFVIVRRLSSS